jgi:Rrf2 family nitric oxide-sensitive transcriptional repressor
MRLTVYTDYALRLLMYVALKRGERATILEAAQAYGISKNHLMKVANDLGRHGLLETVRGRGGGLKLAKPADRIKLGDVVRRMEDDLAMVECFAAAENTCPITGACRLRGILRSALEAYLAVLDKHTLADLTGRNPALAEMLLAG